MGRIDRNRSSSTALRTRRHAASFLAAGLLTAGSVLPAWAGRPLVTEDASLLQGGACQLELFSERLRAERASWAVPACNPFGNLEIRIGVGRGRDREADGEVRRLKAWQLKTVLRHHDEQYAGFGVAFSNQRDPALHRGQLGDTELKGLATVPLQGEALLAHVNLGWLRERDDGAAMRQDRVKWAAALDLEALPRTRASFESYGQGSERPWGQLGLRYGIVPGHLQLDASIGGQYRRSRESRYFTVGLVFVTPSLLR